MGWRTVVISKTAKLDYKMGYLCIRSNEEIIRVLISEISMLIIESTSVSLTAYLLVELAKEKVNIVFCNQKRLPDGCYIPFYGAHDTSDKLRKQIIWTQENKNKIWKDVVYHKILGQSSVLEKNSHQEASKKLLEYLPQIELGDITNREGHAAKVYFNALFGMGFVRNDSENVINAGLNYGYSILLSMVAREVVSNGYITQLGIFHDNMFNDYNLASDLMEPFRPFVDQYIIDLDITEMQSETKAKLANILNIKVRINGKEQYLSNALTIYIKSILDAITYGVVEMIKFPDYDWTIYESNSIF